METRQEENSDSQPLGNLIEINDALETKETIVENGLESEKSLATTPGSKLSRWQDWKNNVSIGEVSGALGDLGTLLPLLVALSKAGKVSLTSSLVFGGIFNLAIGLYFNIPLCVQPMKSIAAVALVTSNNITQAELVAGGFYVSAVVFVLGITTSINWVNRLVPLSVVRGIQMGTGLVLMASGVTTMQASQGWTFTNFAWMDNFLISILSFLLVLSLYHTRNTPSALILFLVALIFSLVTMYALNPTNGILRVGWYLPQVIMPAFGSPTAIIGMALGQLPLTLLNSVIAVSKLADDLFPQKIRHGKIRHGAAPTIDVAIFVGLFNIIGCWFGSIPYCSGSGGLAGQYRFGARTGLSVVFLGLVKLLLGFLLGSSLTILLGYFPNSILGVMLVFAGLELALATKDMGFGRSDKSLLDTRVVMDDYAVMFITGGMLVGWRNDGIAFVIGCITAIVFSIKRDIERHGWSGCFKRGWKNFVKKD